MSVVNAYKDVPIYDRLGAGMYTYKCVIDNDSLGVKKYDIFANSINEALYIIGCTFGNVLSWCYIGNDVMSLDLAPYPNGTCLIYQ